MLALLQVLNVGALTAEEAADLQIQVTDIYRYIPIYTDMRTALTAEEAADLQIQVTLLTYTLSSIRIRMSSIRIRMSSSHTHSIRIRMSTHAYTITCACV